MDELRPEELAAVIAAWHNRHPLARRITPAQVQGIGWVALPFVQRPGARPWAAPDGGLPVLHHPVDEAAPPAPQGVGARLRDRAQARAQGAAPARQDAAGAGLAVSVSGAWPRLLAALKQALRAGLEAPARLRAALQAAWQQQARWRLRTKALRPAFSEDFIAPISPRQVASWALRHGQLHARSGRLPVREVRPDAQWGRQDTGLVTLYLATAAVEVGSRRARVLLPASGAGATLGPRLLSPQRAAAAMGVLVLVGLGIARPAVPPPADWPGVAAAQAVLERWAALASGESSSPADIGDPAMAAASAAADDAASAAWASTDSAASAPASAPDAWAEAAQPAAEPAPVWAASAPAPEAVMAAPSAAVLAAPATAAAASQALALAPASPLLGADPDGGASTLPPDDPPPPPRAEPFRPGQPLVRPLDEATKAAARETVAALRAARGDPPPGKAAAAGPLAVAPMPAMLPDADAAAALGPAFALTTRPLRTRAESEQVQFAVRALLAKHSNEPLLVELMPAGDDWRVVCWPFTRREDAQLARALLLSRGLRLEAIEF